MALSKNSQFSIATIFLYFIVATHTAEAEEICIGQDVNRIAPLNQLFSQYGNPVEQAENYLLNSGLGLVDTRGDRPVMSTREETPKLIGSVEFQKNLEAQSVETGLWLSVAEILRVPTPSESRSSFFPNNPNLSLDLNRLCFDLQAGRIVFNITAKKTYDTNEGLSIGIWYRWSIAVEEIFIGSIEQIIGGKTFNLKLHARAPHLKVISFEVGFDKDGDDILDEADGEIAHVKPFSANGSINPLYAVRHPNNTDCIDIDIAIPSYSPPGDLGTITELNLEDSDDVTVFEDILASFQSDGTGIQFCAGSCSGYMLAASNGG